MVSYEEVFKAGITNIEPDRQRYFIDAAKRIVADKVEKIGRPLTYNVVTFGCQMNARDSEKLEGILIEAGFEHTDSEDADYMVYNTCTVRENANNKLYGHLGYVHNKKKKNPHMKVALCGCMMQEEHVVDTIRTSYRFIDLVFGTYNIYKFAELLASSLLQDEMIIDIWKESDKIVEDLPVERKYLYKSGVNIMFGCNNFCSYCIVPYVRGRERSRKSDDIIAEIKSLVADGVFEIMLLGQNVNSYGHDLGHELNFASLLREVAKIEGLKRIRFMTSHPKDLSDELIEVMAEYDNICNHIHLPLQSGSDRILKDMNRHYTKGDYLEIVDKLNKAIPGIAITTDIIVGYPGETEEDFNETLEVVEKCNYDSAFTFIYSKRSGTPAARRDDFVDDEVTKVRFNKLLRLVKEKSAEKSLSYVGSTQSVIVEGVDEKVKGYLTGRMQSNSLVHFPGDESLIGSEISVNILESKGFYFVGEKVS